METLLQAQRAEPSSSIPKPTSLRSVIESIVHLPHTKRESTVDRLKDVTKNLHNNRQKVKSTFMLVWYLYTLTQQRDISVTLKDPDPRDPANTALDVICSEFMDRPFAISRSAQTHTHATFSVLNHDHDIATKKEELAKRLGKDWINLFSCNASSSNASSNPLLKAQIVLFELVWGGTIQRLNSNPTHNVKDPGHAVFQQTLDQLDRWLQEVIGRSLQPTFTFAFYGMVKAGKSLFLNAMIGKDVLPSGGMCTRRSSD